MNIKYLSVIIVVFIAALSRLLPHPPNFTPIIAIGLFSGFCLKNNKKIAFLLPISAMIISDIFLGFYFISIFVYSALAVITVLGFLIKEKNKFKMLFPMAFTGSLLFFNIRNFGVFLIGYPNNLSGLIACYTAAIPFFQNSLFADLFFSGIIFLSYDIIMRFIPMLDSSSTVKNN